MSTLIESLLPGSPTKSLQFHMDLCHECVVVLGEFLIAAYECNWEKADYYQQEIKHLENEADEQKRAIRKSISSNLLMPYSRADAISLLSMQDKLANKAKDVAGLMLGRQMIVPTSVFEVFTEHYEACKHVASTAKRTIDRLDVLLESGFAQREVDTIMTLVDDLDSLEEKSDETEIRLRKALMEIEDTLPPVHIMFLYQVIRRIGDIADIGERIGNRLVILVSK